MDDLVKEFVRATVQGVFWGFVALLIIWGLMFGIQVLILLAGGPIQ